MVFTWCRAGLVAVVFTQTTPGLAQDDHAASARLPADSPTTSELRAGEHTSRSGAVSGTIGDLPPAYQEAVTRALAEYEQGRYDKARPYLEEAHRLFPSARTLRSLGKVEFDLGNYVTSIAYLDRALNSEVRPLDEDMRADASRLLTEARRYVSTYRVTLRPSSARLTLDGVELPDDRAQHLTLSVGTHTLVASAEGYETMRKTLRAEAGAEEEVHMQLSPSLVVQQTLTASEAEAEAGDRSGAKWWIIGGVGGAVVVGVATALTLHLRKTTVEPPDTNTTTGSVIQVE